MQERKIQVGGDNRTERLGAIPKKKSCLNSPRNCSRRRKRVSSIYRESIRKHSFGKIYRISCRHSYGASQWTKSSTSPGRKFENSPVKLGEINDFVRKVIVKSSPGLTEFHKSFTKRCPKILALHWKLLREAHL